MSHDESLERTADERRNERMESINADINALHSAYCDARGLEMRLDQGSERIWFEASHAGITPDDVKLVVKYRMRLNSLQGAGGWSLLIKRLVGDDDAIGVFNNQLAEAKAQMRKKVFTPAKQEVLRATGRPDEPEAPATRSVNDVLIEVLKKATG